MLVEGILCVFFALVITAMISDMYLGHRWFKENKKILLRNEKSAVRTISGLHDRLDSLKSTIINLTKDNNRLQKKIKEKHNFDPLACSFCGKTDEEVKKLIAGPFALMCDECVELSVDIIKKET